MNTDCDVVVVGAGFSGLYAAKMLMQQGHDVRVLEARPDVGGRTKPVDLLGHRLDAGGQWLGEGHHRLSTIADQFSVCRIPQYTHGRSISDIAGKLKATRTTNPALTVTASIESLIMTQRLERMAKSVPNDAPWMAKNAQHWDAQSLADWQNQHVHSKGAKSLLNIASRALLCVETADVSLLHFLSYLHSSGGVKYLTATKNGAQAYRFQNGLHQLASKIANELGDRVITSTPVEAITQHDSGVIITAAAQKYSARHAVVALAPTLINRIEFSPALPKDRVLLNDSMPMGSVIKCHVAYATPFWRKDGLSGEAISDEGDFSPIFDGSPEDESIGILTGFFEGDAARRLSKASAKERRCEVLRSLRRYFGDQAANPIGYVEQDWLTEHWSEGCYTAVMPPGVMTRCGHALRQAHGRIHWAGTETASEFTGYVEGALQAGERAAQEIHQQLSQRQ